MIAKRGTGRIAVTFLAAASTAAIMSGPAFAATINVTTEADSGNGSLRSAIEKAGNGDKVSLSGGTYELKRGDIRIGKDITIDGRGRANTGISANRKSGIFTVKSGAKVSIQDVGLFRGKAQEGGAIYNEGELSLKGVRLAGNQAKHAGGAVLSTGELTAKKSQFFQNKVKAKIGTALGGAISSLPNFAGPVVLDRVEIAENSVIAKATTQQAFGGAISISGLEPAEGQGPPNLIVQRSRIQHNRVESADATSYGGGIYFGSIGLANTDSDLEITSSTVADNEAISHFGNEAFGGGVAFNPLATEPASFSHAYFQDSTIAGNVAGGSDGTGRGGGIWSEPDDNPVTGGYTGIEFKYVTIVGNQASTGPQPMAGRGGGIWRGPNGGYPSFTASIVANNFADSGVDCYEPMSTGGYNIESATSCGFGGTSLQNTNPLLSKLKDNGGPTPTMKPKGTSPAVDLVNPAFCPAGSKDQRGVDRPRGTQCDSGAVER